MGVSAVAEPLQLLPNRQQSDHHSAAPPVLAFQRAGAGASADIDSVKREVFTAVDSRQKLIATITDTLFSLGELGFQEEETSVYLTDLLQREGFRVERGVAGMPTAFSATWGSGKPDIGLMADIDGLPETSQKPGVAYHDPIVANAPGHGEGHNAGSAVTVAAALALRDVMTKRGLTGTIRIIPGVAEEAIGSRGYMLRSGVFTDMDLLLSVHVSNSFGSRWGHYGSGLVSTVFSFHGKSAHGAGSPWLGRSALDAVILMESGWNFRREHLRLSQRSHAVIVNGGDQPNVVPPEASVWYYLREIDYEHIKDLHDTARTMAKAAAMMTDTTVSERVYSGTWPRNANRVLATQLQANAKLVGMPKWSDSDQQLARGLQRELKVREIGLRSTVADEPEAPDPDPTGGGTDDIGDLHWNFPVANLFYPANIPGATGHHWSSGVAMATPIAHKGAAAGAKALAATVIDLVMQPQLVADAKAAFAEQTRGQRWVSLIPAESTPPIELNADKMARYRPMLKKYRFDPTKYDSYLEQLGVSYPKVRDAAASTALSR